MLFHSSIRKELARSFGATLIVLVTVVMTMTLIRTLGQASRGSFNPSDVMLVMGYGEVRLSTVDLWSVPRGLRHLASLLTLFAFILLAAAYLPRSAIKARLRHPMTRAVKLWAFSHLLVNARAADLALFGGFLLWSVLVFRAARARDRAASADGSAAAPAATSRVQDVAAVLIGTGAWAGFAFWGHAALIGIRPFS